MLIFTIIVNLIITLFNLYLAIKIWQLRQKLSLIAHELNNCEIFIHSILVTTPNVLIQNKNNLAQVRQKYQLLQLQLKQTQQIIIVLNWLYQAWRKVKT
ncbi:hypothetical protein Sta7437_4137 [Stanieria cyanosphaera PCC 7437]|uniref:Uncharacterized protein n=1 Tax=Stanieria cyanosphaera (strain ATCC 29371 / PCC 7437) TaxID=111780 RepID=K9Y003_STAC7|nr:hypothetical protein [Stanieria cyanosphaera]AFZ37614.1 hypothetical protein Sta7437_4137 [Stanieria cyanosphaera PCC 7437]